MISPESSTKMRSHSSSTSPILCSISSTPDPEFAGNPFDDGRQIVAFMLGHAGSGLVQQQIAGLAHDGAADGDTPLVGVGQCPGDRSREVGYAQPVHHALGLRDRIAPGETEAYARDLQIVQNR